jgi:hypothetical protein
VTISTGPVVINIVGLQPGVTVEITETIGSDGSITITITLPPGLGAQETASGVVTNVGDDTFEMTTGDGANLRLHMAADRLSALPITRTPAC